MPRINVYLPDDLADRARRADLNVSALAQEAIRQALAVDDTNRWLATLARPHASAVTHEAAMQALDAARDEPSTRHG